MKILHLLLLIIGVIGLITGFMVARSEKEAVAYDYKIFRLLPVLHEGRLKPLDSFARIKLEELTGEESWQGRSATSWLAEIIFNPAQGNHLPVFKISNEALKQDLGLRYDRRFFTFEELKPGLQKTQPTVTDLLKGPGEAQTETDEALLQLHEKSLIYAQLLQSLSLILPLELAVPEKYADRVTGKPTYLELFEINTALSSDVEKIVQEKGNDPAVYNEEERKTAILGFALEQLTEKGESSDELKIMPANYQEGSKWVSPWVMISEGYGSPQNARYLSIWRDIAYAWRDKNILNFSAKTKEAFDHVFEQDAFSQNLTSFKLEVLYNQIKPYNWIVLLYAAAFFASVLGSYKKFSFLRGVDGILMAAGILLHGFALSGRILILDRPPVGTLYESVLFVSLICALLGLIISFRKQGRLVLLASSFCACLLLLIAPFILQQAESLTVLSAVLNTNFWLVFHVLFITTGYGVCIVAGVMAHLWLFRSRAAAENQKDLKELRGHIDLMGMLALFMTAVGTILGGIWADQSWGRFWGWDPKENGALLIVLWLVWIQHGRLTKYIHDMTFMILMAFLNIIVALAWFGVNLLNVGLHSYGFTEGIAGGLLAFCIIQTFVILLLWLRHTRFWPFEKTKTRVKINAA